MVVTYEIYGFQFEADSEEQVPKGAVLIDEDEEDSEKEQEDEVDFDESNLWELAPEEGVELAKGRDYKGSGLKEDPDGMAEERDDQKKKALKMNIDDIHEYRDEYCGASRQKQSSETEDSE